MLRYLRRLAGRGPGARPLDDPARLVHDEAERDDRDAADHLAGVREPASVRARSTRPTGTCSLIGDLERWLCADHGLRRGLAAAQLGRAGRVRRAARDPRLPPRRGDAARDICLIPASAHGTNAASAVMAGMRVVVVGTDDARQRRHGRPACEGSPSTRDHVAALMITYPSTHGVFETTIAEICGLVHDARRAGVRRRREHERPRRSRAARPASGRRLAPEPAQDVLHPARGRRPRDRPGRGTGASRAAPSQPSAAGGRRPASGPGPCPRRRGARRESSRSRGPTSG